MTTAPRPVSTIRRSVASFRQAGFDGPLLVVSDGLPSEPLLGPVELVVNDPPRGGLRNWLHAFRLAVKRSPGSWVGVLEDDILWAEGAAAALDAELGRRWPADVGYLSLYLARKVSRELESRGGRPLRAGWHESQLGGLCWGSQAYLFPPGMAGQLAASRDFEATVLGWVKNRNRDGIISGWLSKRGMRLMYRVPSLVSHDLGSANSSLAPKPVQRSLLCDYWTGRP
jgi:hypothetical protein